jgi:hypothetical protein
LLGPFGLPTGEGFLHQGSGGKRGTVGGGWVRTTYYYCTVQLCKASKGRDFKRFQEISTWQDKAVGDVPTALPYLGLVNCCKEKVAKQARLNISWRLCATIGALYIRHIHRTRRVQIRRMMQCDGGRLSTFTTDMNR